MSDFPTKDRIDAETDVQVEKLKKVLGSKGMKLKVRRENDFFFMEVLHEDDSLVFGVQYASRAKGVNVIKAKLGIKDDE